MTNAGGCSAPGKRSIHGQEKSNRLNSTSRMAATITDCGRECMGVTPPYLLGPWPLVSWCHPAESGASDEGLSTEQTSLFTELPRRVLLGNRASGILCFVTLPLPQTLQAFQLLRHLSRVMKLDGARHQAQDFKEARRCAVGLGGSD